MSVLSLSFCEEHQRQKSLNRVGASSVAGSTCGRRLRGRCGGGDYSPSIDATAEALYGLPAEWAFLNRSRFAPG
jgi:hypothetical protein